LIPFDKVREEDALKGRK